MARYLACMMAFATGVFSTSPVFPKEYSAVILMRMPYIPLKMPLRVLTSDTTQKIEYHNGLQVDTSSKSGVHKLTFNNSKRVCLYSPPSAGPKSEQATSLQAAAWQPTVFLPDLSQYTEGGEEVVDGILCKKFSQYAHHGSTGSMDDRNTFYWDLVLNKPYRWHMHSRPVPFGSHTDEYIFDFISFEAGAPSAGDLVLPSLCSERPTRSHVSIGIDSFLKARSLHVHNSVDKLNEQYAGQTAFKVNRFMDMTRSEVLGLHGVRSKRALRSQRRSTEQKKFVRVHESDSTTEVPKQFDWRSEQPGVVGPVKDQAMCGSCWTYGTIEPIESAVAIQTKTPLLVLPEQFVLDCTWTNNTGSSHGNLGCDGGDSDIGALEIVRKFGGVIPTAKAYGSYLAVNGYCKDTRLMDTGAKITGWYDIKDRDEAGMMQALVTKGPLSVAIQVPGEMLYYDSGVLNVPSCRYNASDIDHAVVLVGYGNLATIGSGLDYYSIRNSWSTWWGDLGYIKIARGDNDCCVSCQAGYPDIQVSEMALASVVV